MLKIKKRKTFYLYEIVFEYTGFSSDSIYLSPFTKQYVTRVQRDSTAVWLSVDLQGAYPGLIFGTLCGSPSPVQGVIPECRGRIKPWESSAMAQNHIYTYIQRENSKFLAKTNEQEMDDLK